MFSSEQLFVINGEFNEDLEKVLSFALGLMGKTHFEGFYKDEYGLVFCDYACKKAVKPCWIVYGK